MLTEELPADYLAAAEIIRQHFHPPTSLSLPFWARVEYRDTTAQLDVLGHGLDSQLSFRLKPTGRLADANIVVATASPELNESLAAAIRRADSAGAFGPPSREVRGKRGWIELRLVNWTAYEGPGVGLVRLHVPILEAEAPAEMISIPPPMYPPAALQEWAGDSLTLQYVVLESGRVDANSFRVITGKYVEFAKSAIAAVTRGRFKPARVRGCPVPLLVQQRVTFQMHD